MNNELMSLAPTWDEAGFTVLVTKKRKRHTKKGKRRKKRNE